MPRACYVPQGGFALIDLIREAPEGVMAAYTTGMGPCEPLSIYNRPMGRLVFCHLDSPSRLDVLAELIDWVAGIPAAPRGVHFARQSHIEVAQPYHQETIIKVCYPDTIEAIINQLGTHAIPRIMIADDIRPDGGVDQNGEFRLFSDMRESYNLDPASGPEEWRDPNGEHRFLDLAVDLESEEQKGGYICYTTPSYRDAQDIINQLTL